MRKYVGFLQIGSHTYSYWALKLQYRPALTETHRPIIKYIILSYLVPYKHFSYSIIYYHLDFVEQIIKSRSQAYSRKFYEKWLYISIIPARVCVAEKKQTYNY